MNISLNTDLILEKLNELSISSAGDDFILLATKPSNIGKFFYHEKTGLTTPTYIAHFSKEKITFIGINNMYEWTDETMELSLDQLKNLTVKKGLTSYTFSLTNQEGIKIDFQASKAVLTVRFQKNNLKNVLDIVNSYN